MEQRTLEFGSRLALGASFPQVRNMVVRQAMLLAAIGIVLCLRRLMAFTISSEAERSAVFASVGAIPAAVALLRSYLHGKTRATASIRS